MNLEKKLSRAAKRASGFMDLGLKDKAVQELESVLTDEMVDQMWNEDMEEEYRRRMNGDDL